MGKTQFRPCDESCAAGASTKRRRRARKRSPSGAPERRCANFFISTISPTVVFLTDHYDGNEPINCGAGSDVTIRQLAEAIGRVVGFEGSLVFDTSKPDGTPRKLMDSSRLAALGWRSKTSLEAGIAEVYRCLFVPGVNS